MERLETLHQENKEEWKKEGFDINKDAIKQFINNLIADLLKLPVRKTMLCFVSQDSIIKDNFIKTLKELNKLLDNPLTDPHTIIGQLGNRIMEYRRKLIDEKSGYLRQLDLFMKKELKIEKNEYAKNRWDTNMEGVITPWLRLLFREGVKGDALVQFHK